MEYFDIVDEQGEPTGEIIERNKAHTLGIRHRAAHIWIVREHNNETEVLLQKRSQNKDSHPGQYDTSSAGHITAGDTPLHSALRELEEELGISAKEEELHFITTFPIQYEQVFHDKLFKDNEIVYLYKYMKEVNIETLVLQEEEVEEVRWFLLKDVINALNNNDPRFCINKDGFQLLLKS